MRFKNFGIESKDEKGKPTVTKTTVRAKGPHGLDITVPFGEEVEVPEIWAKPTRYANGARKPSPIEQVAPQLKPADELERAAWEEIPPKEEKGKAVAGALSPAQLAAQLGLPQGVAQALLEQVKALTAQAVSAGTSEGK